MIQIGHRGARGFWPENTRGGFVRTNQAGVNSFELDIVATKDNVLVVHHDPYLNKDHTRIAETLSFDYITEDILIRDLTFEQLKQYDVGRLKDGCPDQQRFPKQEWLNGEPIPTLVEILSLVKEYNLHLIIEVKSFPKNPEWTPAVGEYVAMLGNALYTTSTQFDCTISSFDWDILQCAHVLLPNVSTYALTEGGINDYTLQNIDYLGTTGWCPEHIYLSHDQVKAAQSIGLAVVPYTVNDPEDIERLHYFGVDSIITDYPYQFGIIDL